MTNAVNVLLGDLFLFDYDKNILFVLRRPSNCHFHLS